MAVKKRLLPLAKVYGVLEPGPVVLVSTAGKTRANIMPMSWHMMMEFEPPTIGCIISNRNYTFECIKKTGECVLNVPTEEYAQQVIKCGNVCGKRVDKCACFGFTPVSAVCVQAPLIDECYVNLECVVTDRKMVTAYNMFILEVVKAWIDPRIKNPHTLHHRGYGRFCVPEKEIRVQSKKK